MHTSLITPTPRASRLISPGACWEAMSRRASMRVSRRSASPRGASFVNPTSLPGLLMWTRSDLSVTTSTSFVTGWADQASNNNNWTAAGGARPTFNAADVQYSNRPSISFPGGTVCMVTNQSLVYGAFTMFLAARCDGTGVGFLYQRGAGPDYLFGTTGNTTSVVYGGGSSAYNLGSNWSVSASPRTFARVFDGTHAGDKLRINGVDQALTDVAVGNPGTTGVSGLAGLMASSAGATVSTGTVAEYILYNRALSGAEIGQVEAYMRALYAYY